jgi:phosphoribosylpyrophosphate synthetase
MVGSSSRTPPLEMARDTTEGLADQACRLGIELTKILVLQYSNQETSVTIGESVRDEDGMCAAFLESHTHMLPSTLEPLG